MAGILVGELPSLSRKAIRSMPNPLDKSTIVSIFPLALDEKKPTIQPGRFQIPAGSYEKPSTLIVGSSSWWKELGNDEPILEIPLSSIQVADSIVQDYSNSLLGCDMGENRPGLFFVPGEFTVEGIVKDKKALLLKAKENQNRWYQTLIKMGDASWANSHGNPLAIWDVMRVAAKQLNVDKPWIKDFQLGELISCVACGALRNPLYPICQACNFIVDRDLANKLGLKVA